MPHRLLSHWRLAGLPALLAWALLPTAAQAQQENPQMRTGDGMLAISANLPPEVRTGEQFTYDVTIANATDNVALYDIKLRHQKQSGLNVESVSVQGEQPPAQQQKNGEPQAKQQKSGGNQDAMTIDHLAPGDSRTLRVTASVSKEGPVQACLLVESYTPAICLQTKAVKPELQIVKAAPKQVSQCEVIELVYTVENGGSGTVGKFQIVDQLADGLRTIDGKKELAFAVDGLEGGDTRRFVASVYATKTGDFKSRAIAKAEGSDLKVRSQNVGPNVVGADLQVQLDGGGTVYSGRPAIFTATVSNTGNARAEDVRVAVRWPEQAQLRNISEPQLASTQGQSQQGQSQQGQSQQNQENQNPQAVAEQSADNQQKPDKQKASGENQSGPEGQMAMTNREFVIAALEPGQSAKFDIVVGTRGLDRIPAVVEAANVCDIEQVQEQQARKTAQARAVARVTRLPALQIFAVDGTDPVATDSKVNYTIRVRNEGDAPDQQVQVTANLPKNLKFDSANGPTKHKQEDQKIVFEPIKELNAGDVVEYTLTATPQSEGEAILKVELDSKSLNSTVRSDEPTKLIKAEAGS